MATITGLTAERMLAIEAAAIVDGNVVGNDLVLTRHDGTPINTGNVRGPAGPTGPVGSDLAVITARPVLDIGLVGHIRAGRQLTAADFTNLGLSVPIGLWNLSDATDASGNGRSLLNKGGITFAAGLDGVASSAARFLGNASQGLYISDTGTNDPFRIKTGSWGCWFRTSRRGTDQRTMAKWSVAGTGAFLSWISAANNFGSTATSDGTTAYNSVGVTDVADDRWHFGVTTYDGSLLRVYVDGTLEQAVSVGGPLFSSSGPFNIGSQLVDASQAAGVPMFGRIDEAFITADVLTDDQIRNLYCVKIPHTLGTIPTRSSLRVRRLRRAPALVAADFPTLPRRLHNFSAGSLGDEGANNVLLTNNGSAVPVGGVDGVGLNAFHFAGGQSLSGTDAGLPQGLAARSYGFWMKTLSQAAIATMGWGTVGNVGCYLSAGVLYCVSGSDQITGPFLADGVWHSIVVTEDDASIDTVKRKLYVDGRLVGASTGLQGIVLLGANRFRIGSWSDGATNFIGQLDAVFVCDYILSTEDVLRQYAKGTQPLLPSPKNVGDHVESCTATDIFATFDTLDTTFQIDLAVAA
jgi:hypothetical protein